MAGKAIIFSAPSGSGKSSIVQWLIGQLPSLRFSISATIRPPRGQEKDGVEYQFLSKERFEQLIQAEAFLEYEEVYAGRFYGTLMAPVQELWDQGLHVIFDIDVQGGLSIKKRLGEQALAVYIDVPSLDHLRKRLEQRGTETAEELQRRLAKAEEERSYADRFDFRLVNEDLEAARTEALRLVRTFLAK